MANIGLGQMISYRPVCLLFVPPTWLTGEFFLSRLNASVKLLAHELEKELGNLATFCYRTKALWAKSHLSKMIAQNMCAHLKLPFGVFWMKLF